MDDLAVTDSIVIPAGELAWRFDASGGPGGQHANRNATRAELTFDLSSTSAFDREVATRIIDRLGKRAPSGVVTVSSSDSRSQWANRQRARRRLAETLREAMREDPPRRPTRPSGGARRRRLDDKRRRSDTKRLRRRPDPE